MRKLAFTPSMHGFHFRNDFINHPVPGLGVTTSGLCGGMALAAARYWQDQLPVPTHVPADFPDGSPAGVPPEGSALQGYIYGCQLESFGPLGIASAANWITMPWVSRNEQFNWSVREFPAIQQVIDAGTPVVLGLRRVEGGPMGHQVLAYGYDEADLRIFVYDSNHPNEEKTLRLDTSSSRIVYDGAGSPEWSSIFITGCRLEGPRPTYADLGMQGLTVTGGDQVAAGGAVTIEAVVRNFGVRDAHLHQLLVYVRGPHGENLDALLGGGDSDAQPIAPGGERHIRRTAAAFASAPGDYVIGVSYLSEQDQWINVPALAPGTRNQVTVHVSANVPHPGWKELSEAGNKANLVALAAHPDGRMHAVMAGLDDQLWHNEQTATGPSAPWTGWHELSEQGNKAKALTLAAHPDGRMHAVMAGLDDQLWHNEQTMTGPWASWTGWHRLSEPRDVAKVVALAAHPAGHMHAVMTGLDDQLWHTAIAQR